MAAFSPVALGALPKQKGGVMAGLNRAQVIGNLGRDPEIKYTKDNKPVANFSVAVNESWKDKDGEWQEKTEWVRCVAFGYAAEKAEKTFAKGKQVYVEGKIETRDWEDDSGQKRYMTEVVVRRSAELFCTGRKEEGGKPAGVGGDGHFAAPPMDDRYAGQAADIPGEEEDDLPFS